jgi:hypothetical protein
MPQPNKGSAGKPNVSAPIVRKGEEKGAGAPTATAGVVAPVGIIKGTKGK